MYVHVCKCMYMHVHVCTCTGWPPRFGPLEFRASFFPCVPDIRISFVVYNGRERSKLGWKTTNFEPFLINNALWCKMYPKSAHFSISHTTAHDRLDDMSIHHKAHFPQITSVFKPSHNMVRSAEERFAMERMATRGFGAKKIAAALVNVM